MRTQGRSDGGPPWRRFSLGLGVWIGMISYGMADEKIPAANTTVCPKCQQLGPHHHDGSTTGTLGSGKPGLNSGFQGFGLGYHLGYGYGGDGLGVGADGGYPFYGGPGYPHPWPTLRRLGPIMPFSYFGGPGGPTAACRNYFGGVGPLVADRPVIEIESEPGEADYRTGYGNFTGSLPYSEAVLAPFTSRAANGGK
jgi:hypothetical protein